MNSDKTTRALKLFCTIGEISDLLLEEAEAVDMEVLLKSQKRKTKYKAMVAGFSGLVAIIFFLFKLRKKGLLAKA